MIMNTLKSIWSADKALSKLRDLPRVTLNNIKPLPPNPYEADHIGKPPKCHIYKVNKGVPNAKRQKHSFEAIGFEKLKIPMAYRTPKEKSYNYGWFAKRQYPPLTLKTLQLLIETGRVDASKPIDLAAISNSNVFRLRPECHHFGVNLTDEGADCFKARVNIEVQWASEASIAAVERNGGVITTAFYDINSVRALVNPKEWFLSGKPIPRRFHPPQDCVDFYTDPVNRGYLADPSLIAEHRYVLAQKYGYEVESISPSDNLLSQTKDPRQVFYGLQSGWIVNLKDKVIFKPQDEELKKYYSEEFN